MWVFLVIIGVAEVRCVTAAANVHHPIKRKFVTTATGVDKFVKREVDAFNSKFAQNSKYKDTPDYAKNRGAVCAAAVRGLKQLPENQKNELLAKYKSNAKEHCAAEIQKFHLKIE